MKRITTLFIYLLAYIAGIWAQTHPTSVQGIPYDFEVLPVTNKRVNNSQNFTTGKFTFEDIRFWVGEGENEAALVIDWYDEEETALVWGYRWNGEAYGIDMFKAIAQADPRLLLLIQETNLGYTVAGIGYNSSLQEDLIVEYDLESAKVDRNISFGFDEPNAFLNQTSVPPDPLQEMMEAIEEGSESGIIYHPFNYTNYGYACYDYDHWQTLSITNKWKSAWYTGYWSYLAKDNSEETFMYSGLGATLRKLTDGSWDAWGFQDGWDSWAGVNPREPFTAVLPVITLSERNVTFEPGEQKQLIATLHPENVTGKGINWESSNPEIVHVDENGLLTGVSIGAVTVTALISEADVVAASCVVNCVEVPVIAINVVPDTHEMMVGEEFQLEVSFLPENATNKNIRSWISGNPAIAVVDESGKVEAISSGNVTITATSQDGEHTGDCLLVVKEDPNVIEDISILSYKVYPTVTKGSLTVYTQKAVTIRLTDITGKIIMTTKTDSPETGISLDNYPNGIYLLIIEDQITKIIKN